MTNNMGAIIVGSAVGVGAISVISYYVARAMKGSIKLDLAQKSVSSGNAINGTLTVTTKKPITADRLYIGLIGQRQERTHRHGSDGNSTSTRWVEFFRDETDVLTDEELPAGFSETFEFALDTPGKEQVMTGTQALSHLGDASGNETVKKIAKGIGALASVTGGALSGPKRWKVIARLETKGVDLAASKKIHISLKSIG